MKTLDDLHTYQDLTITHLYEHDLALAIQPTGAGKTVACARALQERMADGVNRRPLIVAPIRVAQVTWPSEMQEWDFLQDFPLYEMAGPANEWVGLPPEMQASREMWGQYSDRRDKAVRARTEVTKFKLEAERDDFEIDLRKLNAVARALDLPEGAYITSIENLEWLCDLYKPGQWPFDIIVFDEIGKFKNPKSSRFKMLRKHVDRISHRWGLTATPAPEGLLDLYAPVRLLDERRWGRSYYDWRKDRFYPTDYQGYKWAPFPGYEPKIMAELDGLAFRVPNEMLSYQKQIRHTRIPLTMPAKAWEAYRSMENQLFAEMQEGDDILAMSQATAAIKCRQIVQGFIYDEDGGVHKLHDAKEHALSDLLDSMNKQPMLIAYWFQEDLEAIRRVWNGIPHIGSGTNKTQAIEYRNKWNAGEIPALAVHPQAFSHGLNFQYGGYQLCFFTMFWSLDQYQQTQERIDRQGQTQQPYAHHLLMQGTVDERIYHELNAVKGPNQQRRIEQIKALA